jgi:hypothetical protein
MNYLFIYLFRGGRGWGGGGWWGGGETVHLKRELEMPSLRNPRVQTETGHDILVMFEREYYIQCDATWKRGLTDLN